MHPQRINLNAESADRLFSSACARAALCRVIPSPFRYIRNGLQKARQNTALVIPAISLTLVCLGLFVSGCAHNRGKASQSSVYLQDSAGANLLENNYAAADQLAARALAILGPEAPVMVASFVNIDDLTQSTTFGRLTAEQIASRLAQRGLHVIDLKKRNNVFIKEKSGEFLLSRDVSLVAQQHNVRAVAVGVYTETDAFIYVTARILDAGSGSILASVDFQIRNDSSLYNLFEHEPMWARQ